MQQANLQARATTGGISRVWTIAQRFQKFLVVGVVGLAVNQGLLMMCKGGNFVEFSVMARESSVDWTIIGDSKELNIYGAHLGPGCYPTVIDYLHRGLLKVDGIVTHQLPLERYLDGIHMVHGGKDSIKVLLRP